MTKLKTRPTGRAKLHAQSAPPREKTRARDLLFSFLTRPQFRGPKPSRAVLTNPNQIGSTDSSQRMVDFTEARRMGLPAGDVDKYRSLQ